MDKKFTEQQEKYLNFVIPYRMQSVDIARVALEYVLKRDEPEKMELFFGGKKFADGLSTGWTNPAIEIGIIHARALLDFLGLKVQRKTGGKKLGVRGDGPSHDDILIENFGLEKVSVDQALARYEGSGAEAEKAIAYTIHTANKGVAHMTTEDLVDHDQLRLYEITTRGVNALVSGFLYKRLGEEIPDYRIPVVARIPPTTTP